MTDMAEALAVTLLDGTVESHRLDAYDPRYSWRVGEGLLIVRQGYAETRYPLTSVRSWVSS